MTNEYHLGQEIRKEVQRRGMSATEFADRLCLARQSVYDVFKKRHCATDQLAAICRILDRDFFKELSEQVCAEDIDDDSATVTEMMSSLMPDDCLHCFRLNHMFGEVVDEYLLAPRTKPLVVFYTSNDIEDKIRKGVLLRFECSQVETMTYRGTDYSQAFSNAEELMASFGHHVILLIPVENSLKLGINGGLAYEDIAEELFQIWHDRIHFVVVDGKKGDYMRRHEMYQAYRRRGVFDRLVSSMNEVSTRVNAAERDEAIGRVLFDLTHGLDILYPTELKEPDETGLSRIQLQLSGLNKSDYELLRNNGINNDPLLSIWIDVRNGYVVDYQYRR